MPTTFAEDWKKAKEAFTKATNAKKPSASFLGAFNKGPGISTALKSADAAKTVGDLYSAMKDFRKASDEYTKILDKAITDPKVTDPAAKPTYITAATKLKKDLKEIYDTAAEVGDDLVGKQKKEGVATGAMKGDAEAKMKQIIRPLEKLWSGDFADDVAKKLPFVKMKGFIVELKVNGDVLDVLYKEDRGATATLMIKDAQHACAEYADKYVHAVENLQGNGDGSMKEVARQAQELFKKLHPHLVAAVEAVPKARFDKFRNDHAVYREYQIKTGVSIATGTVQVIGGAVALAAAVPSHGATLGLAVVGLARGLYSTTTQIATALQSVESLQKELVSSVENLTKAYLTEKQKATTRMKVQEMSAAVLAGLLGADALWVESLPKCNKAHDAWTAKLAGLRIGHREATRDALDLMEKANELEAELETSKDAKVKAIAKKVDKIREGVTKGLDGVHTLGDRITQAEKVETKLKEALEELNKALPNYVKVFTVLFPAAVSLGLAAGGAGIDFSAGVAGADLANTVMGLSNEVLSNIKEIAEKATDK